LLEIPNADELVKEFAVRHHIQDGEHLSHEVLPIRVTSRANIILTSAYGALDDIALADPAVGLLLNMLHRNFSLADGAILAFATESGQMAEVTARASIESSVNIAYIVLGEPADRLRAYFDHYFGVVDKQTSTWNAAIDALSGAEAALHRKAVLRRQETNAAMRAAIERSSNPAIEPWPRTIELRFKALGDPLAYRTIYSRMSSEAHGDAEETLRYLFGKLGSEQQFKAMALETVWTTRLYFHYAVSWFVRASIMYATRYGMGEAESLLKSEFDAVQTEIVEISKHIGAGL
jgi:hypothetical protein